MDYHDKIIITGAAGLVGQNLILLLREHGYHNLIAIDKHEENLQLLKKLNPNVSIIAADLAEPGSWQQQFTDAKEVIILHAQITGLQSEIFVRNNLQATELVLNQIKQYQIPHAIHISSSVVNSAANDDYTNTKKAQEKLVKESKIPCCILRSTLMFGWFDPKHLGWLSRFMAKVPVFPIPGHGRYLRQPLYSRDFCRIIIAAMAQQRINETFDIVGQETIDYIDIIKTIKNLKNLSTHIIKIPYSIFYGLLKIYGLFSKTPPFTADQLTALTAGDYFQGVDVKKIFNITLTPLQQAFTETFCDPNYSEVVIKR